MEIGTIVGKTTGYKFVGIVVSKFKNTNNDVRLVVEHLGSQSTNSGGMLHIFSERQLQELDISLSLQQGLIKMSDVIKSESLKNRG